MNTFFLLGSAAAVCIVSFWAALVLTGDAPSQAGGRALVCGLAALPGLSGFCFGYGALSGGAGVFFALGACGVLLHRQPARIGYACLLAANFLLQGFALLSLCRAQWQTGAAVAGFCLLAAPLWTGRLCLFSEEVLAYRPEAAERRSFRLLKGWIGLALLTALGWEACVLIALPGLSGGQGGMLFASGVLLLALVISGSALLLRGMHQRIESLIDRRYQAELNNFMQIIRSQRHDFNFHMQALYGLIEGEHYRECQEYIESMIQNVRVVNEMLPVAFPAVGAQLNTFQEMALQKGIRIEMDLQNDLHEMPCTVYEINTILGNLLQNAIDELAQSRAAEKVIQLLILKRGDSLMLKVSNPCRLSPKEFGDMFRPGYTTKQKHEGLGLANALRTAQHCGGTVYPEFDEGMIHLIVRLPIKHT